MASRKPRGSRARRRRRIGMAAAGLVLGGAAGLAKRAGLDRRLGFGRGDGSSSPSVPIPLSTGSSERPHEPAPSNYDVGGPPANTATHVPVPPPAVPSPIDEEAEEAAAAAEAAGIGGEVAPYASSDLGDDIDEAERPLVESGQGTAEGFEQALAEQASAAEPSDTASAYEKQINDTIEQQDDPLSGERGESLESFDAAPLDVDQPGDELGASATGASSDAVQEEHDPADGADSDARP